MTLAESIDRAEAEARKAAAPILTEAVAHLAALDSCIDRLADLGLAVVISHPFGSGKQSKFSSTRISLRIERSIV